MKPVVQEERTGCGIAAVAAIAGVNYARAKAMAASLGISAKDRGLWSETAHVRRLLASFGVDASRARRPFRAWSNLPDCALLAIKWHQEEGRPFWHWVVFVREQDQHYVLDSKATLKTSVRTDFRRMKPQWFLPVTLPR
jgi:ABC-type bacteriocin/lantibiotic exporter with double-glycine peptidase domain